MKRLLHTIRINLQKLWIPFLLLYSSLILVHQILGNPPPLILYIPFLILVPGYAFTEALLPQLQKLEKITISLALSLALFVGFKSLMQTFRVGGLVSEITISTVLAMICLIAVLIKHSRK